MPSINQMQAMESDSDYQGVGTEKSGALKLPKVELIMFEAAKEFLGLAQNRIRERGKVDTGNLSDIVISQISKSGDKYSLTIGYEKSNPASEYYDFQNKGVKGLKSDQPNSKYKFRTLSVSTNMVNAILQWYLRHKNYIRNEDQRKNLSPLQLKRKTLGQAVDSTKKLRILATNTAKNIKKRGIARVGFFDDFTAQAFGTEFQKKLANALGRDVALSIKQTFDGNTSNTK